MRIAVVHDYFNQGGGADKIAEQLYLMLPGSTLLTTVTIHERLPERLRNIPIRTSWMQRLPFMKRLYRLYFLLYPLAIETLNVREFDVILSSSSGYAKGVRKKNGAVHICYCHNPMRWVWEGDNYTKQDKRLSWIRIALVPLLALLRFWDMRASRRPDYYITNSRYSAARIAKAYERTPTVVHPPIDTERFSVGEVAGDYYLILARLVGYRRIDNAVAACSTMGRRLVVIGAGPDRARLEAKGGPDILFLGWQDDAEVDRYLAKCRALLFTGIEDFGMVPLEAAACGRPTIAYRAGGALETIIDGETGLFYDEQTPEAVADAIRRFEARDWDAQRLRRHAESFGPERFRAGINAFLAEAGVALELSPVPASTRGGPALKRSDGKG